MAIVCVIANLLLNWQKITNFALLTSPIRLSLLPNFPEGRSHSLLSGPSLNLLYVILEGYIANTIDPDQSALIRVHSVDFHGVHLNVYNRQDTLKTFSGQKVLA